MLTVHVWADGDLPAGCSRSFSLNSYTDQGATWTTSGTQSLFDHDSVTINAGHKSGTLTVNKPLCYGQTDFYWGHHPLRRCRWRAASLSQLQCPSAADRLVQRR